MGNKTLTIGDIAEELGVSKTTVSRAISGKGRIGEETRNKVLAYIEAHDYRPNVIARGLAQNKTFNLGLVLPGDYSVGELPFFQSCMIGISQTASAHDYDVLISMVTAQNITQLERAVTNHKTDGIIIARTLVEDAAVAYLRERSVPFVVIGGTKADGAVQVDNDHSNACMELTSRLLDKGVQKIALLGGDENHMVTGERLKGFEAAFQRRSGWNGKREVFLNVDSGVQVDKIVRELLEKKTQCIVSMDDFLCSCVLSSLQQLSVSVPEQVQVASFYDSAFLAGYLPSVTAIRFDGKELGSKACEVLLDMLNGEIVETRNLLGYELRMRKSTESITKLSQNYLP